MSLSPPSFHPASPPHPTALTARAPGRSLKDVFETGQAYVALSRVSSLEGLRLKGFNPAVVRANARVKAFYADMDACAPAPAPAPARPPRRCARSTRAPTGSDAPCSLHPARPRYRDARAAQVHQGADEAARAGGGGAPPRAGGESGGAGRRGSGRRSGRPARAPAAGRGLGSAGAQAGAQPRGAGRDAAWREIEPCCAKEGANTSPGERPPPPPVVSGQLCGTGAARDC